MPKALPILIFALFCCYIVTLGTLVCFAPARLKHLHGIFLPKGDRSQSAGFSTFRWLHEKQAHPSVLNRASGLLLMVVGAALLIAALFSLFSADSWR